MKTVWDTTGQWHQDQPQGILAVHQHKAEDKEWNRDSLGELESQDGEKAGNLNTFSANVFTSEDPTSALPTFSIDDTIPQLSDVDISPSKVMLKPDAFNPCNSPGPDDIHPKVLQETQKTISTLLVMLFIYSWDTDRYCPTLLDPG